MKTTKDQLKANLETALKELEEIKSSLPAHSIRPWQFQELERAEQNVAAVREALKKVFPDESSGEQSKED